MNIKLLNYNVDSSKLRIYHNTLFIGISHHAQNHARKLTIFLLLPRLLLLSLSPSSGRKNVMSMRELFWPDPLAGFKKMAEFQIFFCLKIKCFHS